MLLTSWKDIAAYLGRGVRTVQRWERNLGLPVRRIGGTVQAAPEKLEDWIQLPNMSGSWTGTVTKAGLLSIPASLRGLLDTRSRQFFVTSFDGRCARIYGIEKWEAMERRLMAHSAASPINVKFKQVAAYYGRVSRLTENGILIPTVICEKATLVGEVHLIGRQDHIGVYRLGDSPQTAPEG